MNYVLLFLLGVFDLYSFTEYSNKWIIKGNVSKYDLKEVTKELGFIFQAELPTGHFVLSRNDVKQSSKRKSMFHTKKLLALTKIDYVEQEEWIQVSQRQLTSFPPSDPKWGDMWYMNEMKNVSMGILQSWRNNFSGKGINIAIVDDGVDFTHNDLKDRYDQQNSYDVYDNDNDPSPSSGFRHGTKCAGVALGSTNHVCALGPAFEANLIAVRLIGPRGVLKSSQVQGFSNSGAHISSNSWGGIDHTFDGPSGETKSALKYGVSQLRDKKGVIYVFAAGNGGFDDNCNTDGYVNSIYTIGINAVTIGNDYPGYAEKCTAVLASTYSGDGGPTSDVITTDVGQGCVTNFRGTSAAAPLAAGILALVLQANPSLHWRDVQELIVRHSKTDILMKYGKFKVNGVGRKVSDVFGYGLLDSKMLIAAALKWTSLPEQHTCTSGFKNVNQRTNSSYVSEINTIGCNDTGVCVNSIEHVEAEVVFDYTVRGFVEITLESPSGTVSKLLTARNSDKDKNKRSTWTYMSVHHWGERPLGKWKLKISVLVSGEYATLIGWRLILYGTGVGCTKKIKEKPKPSVQKLSTVMIIIIIISCCVVAVLMVISIFALVKRSKKKKQISSHPSLQIQTLQVQTKDR